jgi:hypothetical protein
LRVLLLTGVVAWLFGERFIRSVYYDRLFVGAGKALAGLLPAAGPDITEPGYDYDKDERAWAAHPESLDWADIVPPDSGLTDGQQTARAAVFFVYPTGYFGMRLNSPKDPSLFSDPLGVFSDLIADVTGGMIHASIYNSVGRIFTPRYRQVTGWGFMLDDNDPRKAQGLDLALRDVSKAFDHFLKVNEGSPIILAGHSQGSILLCKLLKQRFPDQAAAAKDPIFKMFVAAYLIGADLGPTECGEVVRECTTPGELRCFVHFNILMEGGDRSRFLLAPPHKNLSCVNPLSFRTDELHVPPEHNPGSRPILRPLRAIEALIERFYHKTSRVVNLMSQVERGRFGARCSEGVVWVNHHPGMSGYWTTGVFPGMNIHGGESSFFYVATRMNAEARLKRYLEEHH